MEEPKQFHVQLKKERETRNMSQDDLAHKLRCDTKTINRWESGKFLPRFEQRQGLCNLFKMKPEELGLIQGSDKEETEDPQLRNIPFDDVLLIEPAHFVGRQEDLAWLVERLRTGGDPKMVALRGLGGIGKTALAARAVHQLHQEGLFPDGIAMVACQSLKDAGEVLQRVLSRFEFLDREAGVSNVADLSEIANRLFRQKKILVVLDNIETGLAVDQVIASLSRAGATLLLISRQALATVSVPNTANRVLKILSQEEALELFISYLRRKESELSATEQKAVARIAKALGRHTLALKLSGAYAETLQCDLEVFARELEKPGGVLEIPENEMPHAVTRIFKRSLEDLPENTQLLFALLATFATTDFGKNAVIALASALQIPEPKNSMHTLASRSLADAFIYKDMPKKKWDYERFYLHPLLRVLAVTEFERWPEERRSRAYKALLRYYVQYARVLEESPDPDEIAVALHPDMYNITAMLERAQYTEQDEAVVDICSGMQYLWDNHGYTDASLKYLPWGIEAAERLSNVTGSVNVLRCRATLMLSYGNVLQQAGTEADQSFMQKARTYYELSTRIAKQIHDRRVEGTALYRSGRLARKLGDLQEAERLYEQALPILHEGGNQRELGWTLAFQGQIRRDKGDSAGAEELYQQALAVHKKIGYQRGEGWIIGYLGQLALADGRLDEAEAYYKDHLKIARGLQDRRSMGVCFSFLGEIALRKKEYGIAETYLEAASRILAEVRDPESESWVLKLSKELAMVHKDHEPGSDFT